MSNTGKLCNTQTPYTNYINYSQSVTGSSNRRRQLRNLWASTDYRSRPYINWKSKQIANSKKTTNISVHERLHQQALSKQKIEKRDAQNNSFSIEQRFDVSDLNPTSTQTTKRLKRRKNKSMGVPTRSSLNYGMRLYQKGIKKLEEVERKHKEAMQNREEQETKDLTFHPKINPVSYYFGCDGTEKPEDYLLKQGTLAKDKLEQRRAEMLYQTQQSCSFKPRINYNSRKIAEQRNQFFYNEFMGDEHSDIFSNRQPDQFSQLYDDAMKRVERHRKIYSLCIDSDCTFKPDIGKTRVDHVEPKYNLHKNTLSEKSMIDKFNNENFDPETGQAYYKPKVGRSPSNKRHRSSKSIENVLYGYAKVYDDKKLKI